MSTPIFDKYPRGSDFGGRRVLNLGCGFAQYKRPNVVNIDAFDICNPDVVHDLNKTPYPLEAGSFDLIIANHIVEHLPAWWSCLNECGRLLKPDGVLEIWVPGSGSDAIFGFRDHVAQICNQSFYGTFGTYRAGHNAWAAANLDHHASMLKLVAQTSRMENLWWMHYAPVSFRKWAWKHLRNVTLEDGYFFRKVSVAEHKKEMEEHRERLKDNRTDALLRVQEAAV